MATRSPRPITLDSPLSDILAPRTAAVLKKSSRHPLVTVEDLLHHFPKKYLAPGELSDFSALEEGEDATIVGRIGQVRSRPWNNPKARGRKSVIVNVTVHDAANRALEVSFFDNADWRQAAWLPGSTVLLVGKVKAFRHTLQLSHPEAVHMSDRDASEIVEAYKKWQLAFYRSVNKVTSWQLSRAMWQVLDREFAVPDPIPAGLLERRGLPGRREAFELIHRPTTGADHRLARERFIFEEAFILQVELARRRAAAAGVPATPRVPSFGGLVEEFDSLMPFELTEGQRKIGETILDDLARPHPMQRLLQGEVGSGKTVVALRAMLAVVDAGGQAALLAPTEVLAQQHYRSITAMMGPLAEQGLLGGADQGTKVALLTGSMSTSVRRKMLLDIASGEAGIVIGTHALLEDKVQFADLGLVVVDEQHRFGVEQRAALTDKAAGKTPHLLVMTATPIPRTVAMTAFGDLETSTLKERPAGRVNISTHVVPRAERPDWMDRVWSRVREEVGKGHQVYVVCPRITPGGDSDGEQLAAPFEGIEIDPAQLDDFLAWEAELHDEDLAEAVSQGEPSRPSAATVVETTAELAELLPGLRVEMLHGKLPADEKDAIMRRFAAGDIDVLVATTVIEVGVDVANASTMVVLDADWFGVSQLHQLRGRIGRGTVPGVCLLVSYAEAGSMARGRLDSVASTDDGFELSRVDLEYRREGDILGKHQHGRGRLRLLRVLRHTRQIEDAREEAARLIADDPELAAHPALRNAVDVLYGENSGDFLEKS